MSIEIGKKYINKDGEVVEVHNIVETIGRDELIWFTCKQGKRHILIDYDFTEQYKPYEPIYEWEFVAQQPDGFRHFTDFMTEKEMEYFSFQNDCAYYQRLDFTKRERK